MSTTRLARIPFEHVEAELAAFPIASEASFRSPLVCLDPVTCRQMNLSRAAERDILLSIPSVPLDEFVAIRDKIWFGNRPDRDDMHRSIPLGRYLRRLSRAVLGRTRPARGRRTVIATRKRSCPGACPAALELVVSRAPSGPHQSGARRRAAGRVPLLVEPGRGPSSAKGRLCGDTPAPWGGCRLFVALGQLHARSSGGGKYQAMR